MTSPAIAFIGLGNMGGRMSRRLVEAGHSVRGFDANPATLSASAVEPAASAAAAATTADLVLLSLPDSHVVEAVLLGNGGVLPEVAAGATVVDLSTSAPASTRAIATLFAERGVHYLDAGISGGAAAADAGTLTLMVGGDHGVLDSIAPVLAAFAAKVFHMGPVGTGHTAKILNNFLNAVSLSATSEVMVAGKKAGLDLGVLLDVLNASSGSNWATQNRFPKIIQGDYLKGGLTNRLMLKDVVLYTELIAELGVTGIHSSGPLAAFGLAQELGYGDQISNRVVDALGDASGGIRLHEEGDA